MCTFTKGIIPYIVKNYDITLYLMKPSLDEMVQALELKHKYKIPVEFLQSRRLLQIFGSAIIREHDLIHSNYSFPGLLFKMSNAGTPLIYTNHGIIQPSSELSSKPQFVAYQLEYASIQFTAKIASAITTISHFCKKELQQRYGLQSKVIYHGVDHSIFRPLDGDKVNKAKLGLPSKRNIILFVGRLHFAKNPHILLRATKNIIREIPSALTVFIGDGPLKASLIKLAHKLGLQRNVLFLGKKSYEELPLYYNCADVTVLPSSNEGFGFTIVESMACGTPCVAAESGASTEIMSGCGLLFPLNDYEKLANQIEYLLDNPSLASNLSIKGRERIMKFFTWEIASSKYLKLYSEVI